MFLTYHFSSFNIVAVTIFLKSSVILLITPFTAFSSHNYDMYENISPNNLIRSNSGSLGLDQKIFKLCFLNIFSLSFSLSES